MGGSASFSACRPKALQATPQTPLLRRSVALQGAPIPLQAQEMEPAKLVSRNDCPPVRRDRASYHATLSGVTGNLLSTLQVPDSERPVARGRNGECTVGRHGHGSHPICVACEYAYRLSAGKLP